jgi:2-oxoglutarate dehydrogenase E2 component (dihydrolipoamide succinyltransferase)
MYQARVRMPQMGSSVHESTVIEWKKAVGDRVLKGEPLVSAESDKVEFAIEAPASGVLKEILVASEKIVAVGEVLAVLETDEPFSEEEITPPTPSGPPKTSEWTAPVAPMKRERYKPTSPRPTQRPLQAEDGGITTPQADLNYNMPLISRNMWLSPRVQRLAAEHGLNLGAVASLAGSGTNGRVTAQDVDRLIAAKNSQESDIIKLIFSPMVPPEARERTEPLSRLRKRIAENLTRSVQQIPQVTTFLEVDMSDITAWRAAHKDEFEHKHGAKLTYNPFFALAIIAALRDPENERLNGTFEDDALTIKRYVNLGLAVDSPEGLMVPVLRDADGLGFADLVLALTDIADRARTGKLAPEEVKEGTITLTNFGASGALWGNPIINPPEAAIVGTGAVAPRAIALPGGGVGVRPTMGLSVTFDHRANNGIAAGRFAATVRTALEGMDLSQLEF